MDLDWSPETLGRHFLLTEADMAQVRSCRGAHNRLGFALQLVMLRYLHFPLPSVEMTPEPVIHFVSLQIGTDPAVLGEYSQRREQTRDDHAAQIREYLGVRAHASADGDRLLAFLIERAMQRDDPSVLTEEAEEWLRKEHILFPALSTLQRLVAQARTTAEERIHAVVTRQLKRRHITAMEALLERPHGKRGSQFAWVKEPPRTASAKAILELVEKLKVVREIGADEIDLSSLNRNRVRELAQLGRQYFNTALRRFDEEKRHAIMISFLQDLRQELTDYIVEMLDVLIARIFSRSEKELNVNQAKNGRTMNSSMLVMRRAVRVLLDKSVPDPEVRQVTFQEVPEVKLQQAYSVSETVVRPDDYNHFDYLEKRYSHLREFLPAVLAALPLTASFGPGTAAMSDGIRFGVAARSLYARHNPRYFGLKRGVTVYDMTSDQYSHINCHLREAVAVLDGVLHHQTELPLHEHMTDTHGYTEILFGLFELESRLFSPRVRDLPEQRLYPMDRSQSYGDLDALLRGPSINCDLIKRCWDDMHRVAASLKDGTVTATLLVSKLNALERKNGIHKGIQELGKLRKTLFILNYISDEKYRRRIHRTLNKGEALPSLAREVFFGQQGMFRERDYESQLTRPTCLSLLINAIEAWNTRYMMAAIEHLRATGYQVNDSDLSFLSPLMWEHINMHGTYHFDLNAPARRKGLRPLRVEPEQ